MQKLIRGSSLLIIVTLLLTNVVMAEYKTKSVFNTDYKCVSDEQGGYNHTESGHILTHFKDKKEFFLTHISNIPDKAIKGIAKMYNIKSTDLDDLRKLIESGVMKQKNITGEAINEEKTYSLRKSDQNPEEGYTYISSPECTATKWIKGALGKENYRKITCRNDNNIFALDLNTMRFTSVYIGSWHDEVRDNYYGDSSSFAFGTCKKYYR